MEKGKRNRFYKLLWMWNILRHGLFLKGLNNRLARIGIDIMPYYWVLEGDENIAPPKIRGEASGFSVSRLGEEEVAAVQKLISGLGDKDFVKDLRDGQICVGLKHNGKVAAYAFIQMGNFNYRGREIKLNKDEAYLHSMYTFESYRGKNLAPYLRYQCYQMCRDMGIKKAYSVSDYLNKSTIRFKNKLKAKNTALYLSVELFKKTKKTVLLKKYELAPIGVNSK